MPTIRVLRFSLFDLFVITLGVAAGLGYHRVSGVRWTDALLVSCATWIVVGMAQQAQRAYVVRRSLPKADYFNRNGSGFYVARSIAVFLMFAAAIGFEVARKIDRNHTEFWPFIAFTPALFSLGVISAYTSPGRQESHELTRGKATVHLVLDIGALLLGAVLLLYTVVSAQTVSGLVHIAIRGVEASLPTRWAGKPFHPFDTQDDLICQFFRRAVAASAAAALLAMVTFLLAVQWNHRVRRWLFVGVAVGCIGAAAYLDHWYWTVGYPALSPFLAQYTGTQPWYIVAAGVAVGISACFIFVMRYAPEPRPIGTAALSIPRGYHSSQTITIFLLLAMFAEGMPDWWDFGSSGILLGFPGPLGELRSWWDSGAQLLALPQVLLQIVYSFVTYWIDEPKMLLRLAALLVVVNALRRLRRGELAEVVVPVCAGKLITVSFFAAATLLVAIPAGAWLGFAIMTTTFAQF